MHRRRKDPAKKLTDLGRRVPTFDELKQRPGFARYMESGTYDEVIADWAKGICRRQIEGDEEFCNAAHSYGLLEEDHSMDGIVLIAVLGLVLAPLVVECVASTLCAGIAGGIADATTPEGAAFTGALGAGKLFDEAIDLGRTMCSFTGDTRVLMGDGTSKRIKDIEPGDEVLAGDPETGARSSQKVTALAIHQDTVLDLVVMWRGRWSRRCRGCPRPRRLGWRVGSPVRSGLRWRPGSRV